ncbi:hypothetical protein GP486_000458 [Trichoglossum hirsutum]|uniref:Fe2OG dioxygenase domain-containing protein n=1 Tax=Trichoglossum hirsutum TaxID=265104 RepID=A0A9P8LHS3_9PEZI|nr:hypothetical protein GP486_000458 [Trichoglossum hirsutum]
MAAPSLSSDVLPPDFLLSKVDDITVERINFEKTAIPSYQGLYAVILDNVLSPSECRALVQAAEARTGDVWELAMINIGGGQQKLDLRTRNCGRIIWDDHELVARILGRIRCHLPEIEELEVVSGRKLKTTTTKYGLSRLNERMRFLRYEPGNYFRAHYDGCYVDEKTKECSFYTLHLYLNDSKSTEKLESGATVFHSGDMNKQVEVMPKAGRVLVFQHMGLLHSGGEVKKGVKLTMRTDLMYRMEGVSSQSG